MGGSLRHWDGNYPAGWPAWLKLPQHSYIPGVATLPAGKGGEFRVNLFVKADGGHLGEFIAKQVPAAFKLGKDMPFKQAIGDVKKMDVWTFKQPGGKGDLRISLDYGSGLEGWSVLSLLLVPEG